MQKAFNPRTDPVHGDMEIAEAALNRDKTFMDLTRVGGHLISWEKGVRDVDDAPTLSIRFPGADGRAGSIGPLAQTHNRPRNRDNSNLVA